MTLGFGRRPFGLIGTNEVNWITFAITAYICLALELGLRTLLLLPSSGAGLVAPSFMLVLAVFVALMAPAATVPWAMLVLGALVDLTSTTVPGGPILGPAALGYLLGGWAVLQFRSMVFRESVLTVLVTTFVAGVFIQLTIVFLLAMRGPITGEPIPGFSAADQLVHRFLELMYTVVFAIPLGFVLLRLMPAFGFRGRLRVAAGVASSK